MRTLGQEGYFAEVLLQAKQAQELADRDTPIAYCGICAQDTLPIKGVCLFCNCRIDTGEPVPDLVAEAKLQRQRSTWRASAKRQRDRNRSETQVPE